MAEPAPLPPAQLLSTVLGYSIPGWYVSDVIPAFAVLFVNTFYFYVVRRSLSSLYLLLVSKALIDVPEDIID